MHVKGSIILVGSTLAYRGISFELAYCGAKHGIHGFFESLRAGLYHDESNINLSMGPLPALNTTPFGFVENQLPGKPGLCLFGFKRGFLYTRQVIHVKGRE